MNIIQCNGAQHAEQILAIINQEIVHSTAIYDYRPRALDSMESWFGAKLQNNFPVLGAVDGEGNLMGYASYGTFRGWPAYKYTVEHSVYIHREHRGKGLGCLLMKQLIDTARLQEYHCMIGGIDMSNAASIALHEKLGFVQAGVIREAAFKFERWLDLGFYQILLDTPKHPVDG